jgi:hypothetical protein
MTALIAAAAVGVMWFAYVLGTHHPAGPGSGDVPLIRADERPTKIKPDRPGGMEIPDRDKLIYSERPDGMTTEKLLPPPEAPMSRPSVPSPPRALLPPDPNVAQAVPGAPAATATAPVSTPVPSVAAARPPPAPAVAPAGIRVQVGAMRSEDLARREWDRLKRLNGDLLGNLAEVTVRADLGDRGVFYRVEAGPLSDAKEAQRICGELRRRNFGCTIVR